MLETQAHTNHWVLLGKCTGKPTQNVIQFEFLVPLVVKNFVMAKSFEKSLEPMDLQIFGYSFDVDNQSLAGLILI